VQTEIDSSFDGATVKDWLYRHNISRSLITHLKKLPDGITVNGSHVTVRHILCAGDCLSLKWDDTDEDVSETLIPTEMPLDIIYEDDDLIAVNKPPDMATHPSIGHFTDTLANGLCYYFKAQNRPFVFRAINRLDRDTSGLVLVAKSRPAAASLTTLLQEGGIRKRYTAVLCGRITPPAGVIDAPIRRLDESIILRRVTTADDPAGKAARTVYETIAAADDASVVSAEPVTGRTHQLRVHFAHMGCPIAGDGLYGCAETTPTGYDRRMTRQALHASGLVIHRPSGILTLEAPLPPDMSALIQTIRPS